MGVPPCTQQRSFTVQSAGSSVRSHVATTCDETQSVSVTNRGCIPPMWPRSFHSKSWPLRKNMKSYTLLPTLEWLSYTKTKK